MILAVVLASCDASGKGDATGRRDAALPQKPAASVRLGLVAVPGLGDVLADGDAHVVYMFPPDASSRVSCTGACAGTWPPLAITPSAHALAEHGLSQRLVASLPDPNTGGRIVTYNGYPLYRYAGDVQPGTANGQALVLNGGPWYVLDPHGRPITSAPQGPR